MPNPLFSGGGGGGGGNPLLSGGGLGTFGVPSRRRVDDGGGFLDRLGGDIISAAEAFGTGAYESGAALHHALALADPTNPRHLGHAEFGPIAQVGKAVAISPYTDIRDRNYLNLALDAAAVASFGAGIGLRGAAAARTAGAAARAARVAHDAALVEEVHGPSVARAAFKAAMQSPSKTPRYIRVQGAEGGEVATRGQYSRGSLSHLAQAASDRLLESGAEVSPFLEKRLMGRANKWMARAARVEDATMRRSGHRVAAVAKTLKLTEPEERAIRIVAETAPYEDVLKATEDRMHAARAHYDELDNALKQGGHLTPQGFKPFTRFQLKQAKRERAVKGASAVAHEDRLNWTREAGDMLDHLPDEQGVLRPMFKPEQTRLHSAFEALAAASRDRAGLLRGFDLMDENRMMTAMQNAARSAAGAYYVAPSAARLGKVPGLAAAERKVRRLEKEFDRYQEKYPSGFQPVTRARTKEEAVARLNELERFHEKQLDQMAKGMFGPIDRREVNLRNAENRRARRQASGKTRAGRASGASGRKSILRPTITEERRQMVQRKIDEAIERNPDHPTMQRVKGRQDEINALRSALNPEDVFELPTAAAGAAVRAPDYGLVETTRTLNAHPMVEVAGARLSIARDALEKLQARADSNRMATGLLGAEDVTVAPNAVFIGSPVARTRNLGGPRASFMGNLGRFGHARKPGSFKHATGEARELGMERNDVMNVITERQSEAVRLVSIAKRVKQVRKIGTKTPRRPDDAFVFTDGVLSSSRLDGQTLAILEDPERYKLLSDEEKQTVADTLKMALIRKPEGRWSLDPKYAEVVADAAAGKGVFVPRKMLGEAGDLMPWKLPPGIRNITSAVNNAQKLSMIYLKINYPIVQALSNVGMNFIHQGFAAPLNLAWASMLSHSLGPEHSAMVDDIMGEGAIVQAALEGKGTISVASQKVAQRMSAIADRIPRRASFLHEANKAGFGTPEKIKQLLTDDQYADDLFDVAQRAKEAIVDFGELGRAEREFVREMIFIYPWVKGSTKYAAHFLRDHPYQAAVLAKLGQQGAAINRERIGPVPSYGEGYVPVGKNRIINLASLNPFATPAELGRTIVATASGNFGAARPSESLAPFPQALITLATRRDQFGRPLRGALPQQLRAEFIESLPWASAIRAGLGGRQDVSGEIARRLLGSRLESRTYPGQLDPAWRFLLGGLYPREYNRAILNQTAALEASGR